MKKSDVLKSITSNLEKHPTLGVSRFKNERASIKKKIDNLHGVIEGLDNALKDSALKQKENFTEMLEEILEQKKQCTNDILLFKNKLASLDEKEKNFKVALRGEKFKDYIKLLLSNLKKLDSLEFKSLIRILIPKAIIHLGEAENKLELIYNLDVKTPPVRQTGGMEVFLHGQDGVIPLFPNPSYSEQIKGGEQEDKKWPYIKSGRASLTLGHFLSSKAYVPDIIVLSRSPSIKNKSVLHQKFIVEGFSSIQIAKDLGCSRTTIKKYLRMFGIKKGIPTGKTRHNLAFGERIVKGKVIPCQKELQIIESIVNMHKKEGLTARAIARVLNSMKIPTKKQGKRWDHSVVIGILKRELKEEKKYKIM